MIAESGICLARDISHDAVGGGFWTTASAMGEQLIGRLQDKAGSSSQSSSPTWWASRASRSVRGRKPLTRL
jgi:short subunit dehydrogenase-like uncharacterized protein